MLPDSIIYVGKSYLLVWGKYKVFEERLNIFADLRWFKLSPRCCDVEMYSGLCQNIISSLSGVFAECKSAFPTTTQHHKGAAELKLSATDSRNHMFLWVYRKKVFVHGQRWKKYSDHLLFKLWNNLENSLKTCRTLTSLKKNTKEQDD